MDAKKLKKTMQAYYAPVKDATAFWDKALGLTKPEEEEAPATAPPKEARRRRERKDRT